MKYKGLSVLLYQSLDLSGILISLPDLVVLLVGSVLVFGTVGSSVWVWFIPVIGVVRSDLVLGGSVLDGCPSGMKFKCHRFLCSSPLGVCTM